MLSRKNYRIVERRSILTGTLYYVPEIRMDSILYSGSRQVGTEEHWEPLRDELSVPVHVPTMAQAGEVIHRHKLEAGGKAHFKIVWRG